jgi:hypothetical protein
LPRGRSCLLHFSAKIQSVLIRANFQINASGTIPGTKLGRKNLKVLFLIGYFHIYLHEAFVPHFSACVFPVQNLHPETNISEESPVDCYSQGQRVVAAVLPLGSARGSHSRDSFGGSNLGGPPGQPQPQFLAVQRGVESNDMMCDRGFCTRATRGGAATLKHRNAFESLARPTEAASVSSRQPTPSPLPLAPHLPST